jgi:hypothetical protein
MLAQLNPVEVWSLKINPSDLYNIERIRGDNPPGGGGHTYIQIPARMVQPTLAFLHAALPPLGTPITRMVKDASQPQLAAQPLEFWIKSSAGGQPRMRIARQNRHRHVRFSGWSQSANFPTLPALHGTSHARALLNSLGGIRIFLARDGAQVLWAGFTVGSPSPTEAQLPYASIAWAPSRGGRWP